MRISIIVFLFSLVFAGCSTKNIHTSNTAASSNYDGTIRVLSYNIHHANPPSTDSTIDINAIAAVINQARPHLVALQEVDVNTTRSGNKINQAAEIAKLTGMKYFFAKAINYGGGEYGVAILSKFDFDHTSNTALPTVTGTNGEPRTLATAQITLPDGKKIFFASTHLDAQRNDTNRYIQINKIVEHFQQVKEPVIIAGDFNAVPGSRIINAFDAAFTRSCITNCGFTIPQTNPNKTIDFIAFKPSNGFTIREHKVIDEKYASDHLPVLAVLQPAF